MRLWRYRTSIETEKGTKALGTEARRGFGVAFTSCLCAFVPPLFTSSSRLTAGVLLLLLAPVGANIGNVVDEHGFAEAIAGAESERHGGGGRASRGRGGIDLRSERHHVI